MQRIFAGIIFFLLPFCTSAQPKHVPVEYWENLPSHIDQKVVDLVVINARTLGVKCDSVSFLSTFGDGDKSSGFKLACNQGMLKYLLIHEGEQIWRAEQVQNLHSHP
ncbi:hypothetical protein LPB19_12520 [Marinobacter salinisoli]|uniref:DUF3019 domain-containing protein n=1 Tax=Marinobacter salinisoli TaxID=2769486 RepID=A0ABX7MNZ7_9GAMM|nr:hypothetical protein [Marinobacter salinisoli]QSP94012.1 hypothetical protein LPB19_12520 [Marinobacter salinisoli]